MSYARSALISALLVAAPPALAQRTSPADDVRRPSVCTEQYVPVCGRLNDVLRTYPNRCYARAAGAEVVAQGPCGETRVPPAPR